MSKSFDKSLRQIEESRLLFAKVNNTQNMSRIERFSLQTIKGNVEKEGGDLLCFIYIS